MVAHARHAEPSVDDLLVQRTVRELHLFKSWPQAQLNALCVGIRSIHAAPGSTVIRQGQVLKGLYGVVSGRVAIGFAYVDGRRYIRRFGEPGEISGFLSVFDGKGSPFFYIAQELTHILFVEKSAFLSILKLHPELWASVAEEFSAVQRSTLAVIEERIFETLRVRIARALVCYRTQEGAALHIKLTQEHLAELLGVTRQSVSKELKSLENEGIIKIGYGRITLADPAALERVTLGKTLKYAADSSSE